MNTNFKFPIWASTLWMCLFLASCTEVSKELTPQEPKQPNIIVILADDFGVGDIQAHYPDNKIPTPNLDQLVKNGLSFTDAHSPSAVCTPTRYGLLTGRYSWRTALQEWVIAAYEPPLIKEARITLPEMLAENGYTTACIGKWHLGWNWPGAQESARVEERNALRKGTWDYTQPIKDGPTTHGFDYYFGTHVPNFPPFTYIENDRVAIPPTDTYRNSDFEGIYMPRVFEGSPMAPGWKFENILPDITKKASDYIQQKAQEAEPFFLFFSMTSPHEPVSPSMHFQGKSGIAPIADFVMETDWSVGQIIQAVENSKITENTLIIFTADNGHSHYTGWEKLIEAGHLPSGPYRGHKSTIWEGGHRVPFIVQWPGTVQGGTSSDALICLTDIFATCTELMHAPTDAGNRAEDSFSFLTLLKNPDAIPTRKSIVNHSVSGEFAFRKDGWKIVYKLPEKNLNLSRGKAALIELYNLGEDVGETQNVADQFPKIAQNLASELKQIVESGSSRIGQEATNDVVVKFDTIQQTRWAPEIKSY